MKLISMDASAFSRNAYDLHGGVLSAFSMLPENVELLLSDITLLEIEKNWANTCLSTCREINAKLKKPLLQPAVSEMPKFIEEKDVRGAVQEQLKTFCGAINANIFSVEEGSLKDALSLYASSKPPFGSPKKQDEFKDALILLSLEKIAQQRKMKITVSSSDGDWKAFCEASSHLDYIDGLESLLEYAFGVSPAIITEISDYLKSEDDPDGAMSDVYNFVEEQFYFPPAIEAWAPCEVEAFANYAEYETSLKLHDCRPVFKVVADNDSETRISLKLESQAKYHVAINFSAYDSVDRDYVSLSSEETEIDETIESIVILELRKEKGKFSSIEVVEASVSQSHIFSLGELWPYE